MRGRGGTGFEDNHLERLFRHDKTQKRTGILIPVLFELLSPPITQVVNNQLVEVLRYQTSNLEYQQRIVLKSTIKH